LHLSAHIFLPHRFNSLPRRGESFRISAGICPLDKASPKATFFDIDPRNNKAAAAGREILLSFWKVHILHHAGEEPIHGHWIARELRRHGYEISPGTLYPLLNRMERLGWLRSGARQGKRARKDYRLTPSGQRVLDLVREQLEELYREVKPRGNNRARQELPAPRRTRL
jgi:DNA-binding PadR family transcriptional regulator